MTTPPACTCGRPDGAHDEKCQHIRWVRSNDYDPGDMSIPHFLQRDTLGVFDIKPTTDSVFD